MAGKMRVHELAKELGKTSREIVALLNEMGIPVLSHANTIDEEAIEKIKEKISISKKPTIKLIKKKEIEEREEKCVVIKNEASLREEEKAEMPILVPEEKEQQEEPIEVSPKPLSYSEADTFIDYSAALLDSYLQKEREETKSEVPEESKAVEVPVIETGEKTKKKKKQRKEEIEPIIQEEIILPPIATEITIPEGITLRELAQRMGVKSKHILKRLLEKGYLININQSLKGDLAVEIAKEFGCKANIISYEEEILKEEESEDTEEDLQPRCPVVTVMGHVDHGKTTLLDFIRKTNVAAKEVGGITQHIGAYRAFVDGRSIVFLDTPGHEAFTKIRARGAKATDIVILVVAADDGVMPQTVEAINHAKSANTPIIVAINKIDKPNANVEKVKRQLADLGLVVEEWGGSTIAVPISAKTGENVKELLEMVLLMADLLGLKANPNRLAQGVILESKVDAHRGITATVLIQNGTLHVGDVFIAGCCYGKVKAMYDDQGKKISEAPPSFPVEIIGFDSLAEAGDIFQCVKDESKARSIVNYRKNLKKEQSIAKGADQLSLEHLYSKIKEGVIKEFPLIIKADAHGSIEALLNELSKINTEEIKIKIIHNGIGGINYSDVLLAEATKAIIVGFNVRAEAKARELAERDNIEIRYYKIIYEFIDDIKKALLGRLEPKYKEIIIGTAKVRKIFNISRLGTVAGCFVQSGKISRNAKVRLLRDNVVIHDGSINSLKRFKDDVIEVPAGYECGLMLTNYNDIKEEDTLEFYILEELKPSLN